MSRVDAPTDTPYIINISHCTNTLHYTTQRNTQHTTPHTTLHPPSSTFHSLLLVLAPTIIVIICECTLNDTILRYTALHRTACMRNQRRAGEA